MYLVDTNVISAAAPSRPVPVALVEWMDSHSVHLFMSAVTVAESGLRQTADLHRLARAGYSAFLVGERLIVEADPGAALRTLRGAQA